MKASNNSEKTAAKFYLLLSYSFKFCCVAANKSRRSQQLPQASIHCCLLCSVIHVLLVSLQSCLDWSRKWIKQLVPLSKISDEKWNCIFSPNWGGAWLTVTSWFDHRCFYVKWSSRYTNCFLDNFLKCGDPAREHFSLIKSWKSFLGTEDTASLYVW